MRCNYCSGIENDRELQTESSSALRNESNPEQVKERIIISKPSQGVGGSPVMGCAQLH